MLFSSTLFLSLFLPILILLYWLVKDEFRNMLLLIASLFFYAWGEPIFVFILLIFSIANFYLSKKWLNQKFGLLVYCVFNISLLFVCKYLPSIVHQANVWFFNEAPLHPLFFSKMPLGISFYVFHAISFGVFLNKNPKTTATNLEQFLLYLFLFPHQIAGPIVNFQLIAEELKNRVFSKQNLIEGLNIFALGLARKAILSNGFSNLMTWNSNPLLPSDDSLLNWIEIIAYTFHIYFDFSGYSQMAIGLAKIFGFHFPNNFNRPYISKSITEFWQRWHISLGNFMREFIYIPLGGNQNGYFRTLFNLFFVFIISGIWHGANWTFLVWGIYHGFFIIIERIFLKKVLKKLGFIAILFTFLVVAHGWIFFHKASVTESLKQIQLLWSFDFSRFKTTSQDFYVLAFIILGFTFILFEFLNEKKITIPRLNNLILSPIFKTGISILLYIVSYSFIIAGNENPFIYFNF